MPLYAYTCRACGQSFDRLSKHADADTPAPCGHCKSPHVERQLTAPGGFDLKGQGWYSKGNH